VLEVRKITNLVRAFAVLRHLGLDFLKKLVVGNLFLDRLILCRGESVTRNEKEK
jgi:hypothetical protein